LRNVGAVPPALQLSKSLLVAKLATNTLSIIRVGVVDPLAQGTLASLAHPNGTVTGPTSSGVEIVGKNVRLLREVVPTRSRLETKSVRTPGMA
jgi:putative ABC transport system substrate-binding protein